MQFQERKSYRIFSDTVNLTLKFIWKNQRIKHTIFEQQEEKNKVGGELSQDFIIYYPTAVKTVWYG